MFDAINSFYSTKWNYILLFLLVNFLKQQYNLKNRGQKEKFKKVKYTILKELNKFIHEEKIGQRLVRLPIYPDLQQREQDTIHNAIRQFFKTYQGA